MNRRILALVVVLVVVIFDVSTCVYAGTVYTLDTSSLDNAVGHSFLSRIAYNGSMFWLLYDDGSYTVAVYTENFTSFSGKFSTGYDYHYARSGASIVVNGSYIYLGASASDYDLYFQKATIQPDGNLTWSIRQRIFGNDFFDWGAGIAVYGGSLFLGTHDGQDIVFIYRSDDFGNTWTQVKNWTGIENIDISGGFALAPYSGGVTAFVKDKDNRLYFGYYNASLDTWSSMNFIDTLVSGAETLSVAYNYTHIFLAYIDSGYNLTLVIHNGTAAVSKTVVDSNDTIAAVALTVLEDNTPVIFYVKGGVIYEAYPGSGSWHIEEAFPNHTYSTVPTALSTAQQPLPYPVVMWTEGSASPYTIYVGYNNTFQQVTTTTTTTTTSNFYSGGGGGGYVPPPSGTSTAPGPGEGEEGFVLPFVGSVRLPEWIVSFRGGDMADVLALLAIGFLALLYVLMSGGSGKRRKR